MNVIYQLHTYTRSIGEVHIAFSVILKLTFPLLICLSNSIIKKTKNVFLIIW